MWYPTFMRKTSVYLREPDERRLKEIAEREGLSQAEAIRAAIQAYATQSNGPREFAMAGCASKRGLHASELSDEQLLSGFGE